MRKLPPCVESGEVYMQGAESHACAYVLNTSREAGGRRGHGARHGDAGQWGPLVVGTVRLGWPASGSRRGAPGVVIQSHMQTFADAHTHTRKTHVESTKVLTGVRRARGDRCTVLIDSISLSARFPANITRLGEGTSPPAARAACTGSGRRRVRRQRAHNAAPPRARAARAA